MTEHETSRIGHAASEVLENEAYVIAMEAMRTQVIRQLLDCSPKDAEGLILLHQFARISEAFPSILRGFVEAGKLASHKINLDNLRDESGVKKMMRRVL